MFDLRNKDLSQSAPHKTNVCGSVLWHDQRRFLRNLRRSTGDAHQAGQPSLKSLDSQTPQEWSTNEDHGKSKACVTPQGHEGTQGHF